MRSFVCASGEPTRPFLRCFTLSQLDDKNFKDTVLKSDGVWLVEFYAPWCGELRTSLELIPRVNVPCYSLVLVTVAGRNNNASGASLMCV